MLFLLSLFLVINFSTDLHAKMVSVHHHKLITNKVQIYHQLSLNDSLSNEFSNHGCEEDERNEDRKSCMKAICEKMSSYKCDEAHELKAVAGLCKKVSGASCIDEIAKKMSKYKSDELHELQAIANICHNLRPKSVTFYCSYLPNYRCDEFFELKNAADIMREVNRDTIGCLKFTCSSMSKYRCDESHEINTVIKACQGE